MDWLKLGLVGLLLLATWLFAPHLFQKQSKPSTPSAPTSSVTSKQTGEVDVKQFTGKNFDVLPSMTEIAVEFVRVVDGDTIMVKLNGHELRTRYLMIDTPESVKEGLKPQPFGKDASHRNETLLKNAKKITMMFDKGPKADDYDRALTYIYADGVLVSEQLLSEGLAAVSYVNPPNNTYEKQLRDAQAKAKKQKIGIWSIPNYVNDKGKFNIQQ